MSENRKNKDPLEFYKNSGLEEEDGSSAGNIVPTVSGDESEELDSAEELSKENLVIPETIRILPLRGLVVYPATAVPLTIGQPRSVRIPSPGRCAPWHPG